MTNARLTKTVPTLRTVPTVPTTNAPILAGIAYAKISLSALVRTFYCPSPASSSWYLDNADHRPRV